MEIIREIAEAVLTWIAMPATLLGGAGGLLSGVGHGHGWTRCVFEGVSGAVVANVVFPVVETYAPVPWHYTLFFLSGIGGLKMVESVCGWLFDDGMLKDILKAFLQRLGGGKNG